MRIVVRVAGILPIAASLVLLIATHRVAAGYMRRQGFDLDFAIPYIPPIIAIVLVLLLALTPGPARSARRAVLIGFAFGAHLYLLLPAVNLITQYELISADGTAFWGMQTVPAVYLFPAVLVVGGLLGVGVHIAARSLRKMRDS